MTQTWLITGSSRGLGRSLAEAVLAKGDRLVATARDVAALAPLAERYGHRVRLVPLDVTDAAAARDAVAASVESFGRLDLVVNNAGYGNVAAIEDADDVDFRAQFEVNFFGVVNVTRAAVPVLRAQKSGHFIHISSIGGRIGAAGLSAYQSAKWAVEGFSEVLHREVSPFGVKVTIVEPGGFRTDWAGSSMTVHDIRPDYDASIGRLVRHRDANRRREQGDPAKAAAAILAIAALDAPPLRLLLGSDAVRLAEAAARQRSEADLEWRDLSLSTDFNDAAAASALDWKG